MTDIDLTDSKEWYRAPEQANAYLNLMNECYGTGIIQSEDSLIRRNLESICQASPKKLSYIDLGPGDGKKTFQLCDALDKSKKLSSYVAVDIQTRFLDICEKIKSTFKVPTLKFNMSFEDFLSKEQPFKDTPKFIYLGSTYGNFTKDPIEPRLLSFMKPSDLVYLSAGLRPNNLNDLIKSYSPSLQMFGPVAKRYGLDGGELKVRFNSDNSSIEQIYEKGEMCYILGISKKHSIPSFKEQISKYFDGKYFIEGNHIGFLGRKRCQE